jgi:hypothetical protein
MRIDANTYVAQLAQSNNSYNNAFQNAFAEKESSSDELSISSEGKAMSRMMRVNATSEEREAHKTAFNETVESLNIDDLDVANMSDEEIEEVLSEFEAVMSDYMHDGFKPASEMDSSELKNTLSNIKGMSDKMNGVKGQYGPPPGKGPGGMKPGGMKPMQVESTDETEETDESDLIEALLEALNEEEETDYSTMSMEQILELLNQSGTNI